MFSCLDLFVLLWLYRYVRLIINCIAHWTFKPIPMADSPLYESQDVTIIIPTLDGDGQQLRETVKSCLRTHPSEIILVTIDANFKHAMALTEAIPSKKIRVLSIAHANKRLQTCRAIPEVQTPITVLADDDVVWPPRILDWILAPFEDPAMGGVGTCQRLRRATETTWRNAIWNFLGALYLERRNFDISACTHLDGGLPCLSGRTLALRTAIIQEDEFRFAFTHETWRMYQLNADDDNFITRWMYSHGWKTYIQYHKEAELQTTLEDNPKFLKQCLRWSRSNWRSNLTSMFAERHIWTLQPWSTYAVHLTTLTAWALPTDIALIVLLYKATENLGPHQQHVALAALACWMIFSKFIKLIGHFIRYPVDVCLLPVSILFGYFHGLIKFYAMMTLHVTTWGSRPNADTDDAVRMIRLPPYSART